MTTLIVVGIVIFILMTMGHAVGAILGACLQIFGASLELGFAFAALVMVGGFVLFNVVF